MINERAIVVELVGGPKDGLLIHVKESLHDLYIPMTEPMHTLPLGEFPGKYCYAQAHYRRRLRDLKFDWISTAY